MIETIETKVSPKTQFLNDVVKGLSQDPKRISSKYFYDQKGDELFQQIMALDEYYLTRAEHEIFSTYKKEILSQFSPNGGSFNLIELGAGDGLKTKVLLESFLEQEAEFDYVPIDISRNAVEGLEDSLKKELPTLNYNGVVGDYFQVLHDLPKASEKRVILFLGSNIGNFTRNEAVGFLRHVREFIRPDDILLIGIDLKKDPDQILSAYNDSKGVTRDFNLNLLERINKEVGADFEVNKFKHHPVYNPVTGECLSMLLSTEDQEVLIDEHAVHFERWEPIHTEISRKYSIKQIHSLAQESGFEVTIDLKDSNGYFVDSIWRAV